MTFDCSRFSFQPWNDFLGVVMQQGRVQLDADWNEFVEQLTRRIQAGTLDTIGQAVVPREIPNGFLISVNNSDPKDLMIGAGRMYVDGILVDNHGSRPLNIWDEHLAELRSENSISILNQPYLPFDKTKKTLQDFSEPELDKAPYLVYLDVWQREVTALQMPELIEKALGVDTTGRLQTVWQVKILTDIGANATCDYVQGWDKLTKPSGARLTTSLPDTVPTESNPCLVSPASGYQGLENQLYRVEIHNGGNQNSATFKWSRDNATVASRVTTIPTLTQIVVEHVKRDDLLGFHGGDWIEILDDRHELHGQPGILRRIKGDGVDEGTQTLTLETALLAGQFPVNSKGMPVGGNTRVRRWDQSGVVRLENGTSIVDLNASGGVSDGIRIPSPGNKVILENGILVDFSLEKDFGAKMDLEFKTGDYWVFAARSVDGKIDILERSPPRGIHHHYARLAIVRAKGSDPDDCRVKWPPAITNSNSCDCTVCVHPETHNNGTATIQQAIGEIKKRGGGTICFDVGIYNIGKSLRLDGVKSIRIRGQGIDTLLLGGSIESVFNIENCQDVSIQNLTAINSVIPPSTVGSVMPRMVAVAVASIAKKISVIDVKNTIDFTLDHVNGICIAFGEIQIPSAALSLSGYLIGTKVNGCVLTAQQGIALLNNHAGASDVTAGKVNAQAETPPDYLITADLRITNCFFPCSNSGISFGGVSLHNGNLLISNNLILGCNNAGIMLVGGALPGSLVIVEKNILDVIGTGIQCGLDGMRVLDNEITAGDGNISSGDGIVIDGGIDPGFVDNPQIFGNHIHDRTGHGIAIRRAVGYGMIKSNVIENVTGSGLIIGDGKADYLSIENNHFLNIGPNNEEAIFYAAVRLANVKSADIVGNVIDDIGHGSKSNRPIIGLLITACDEIKITGNRLQNIGSSTSRQNVGIECDTPFKHLAICDNTILAADDIEFNQPWWALRIGAGVNTNNLKELQVKNIGNDFLLMSPSLMKILFITNSGVSASPSDWGATTGIHRNRFTSKIDANLFVIIENVAACLFTENFCEAMERQSFSVGAFTFMLDSRAIPRPLVSITGKQINASNNRITRINNNYQPILSIKTDNDNDYKKFIVLGNICSGGITVNDTDLGAITNNPWNQLNLTT
ncbi:conserved hypothetical protein [Crenothrix polyspora]|uniref:Right handed beta helix domain-containing protein n=1 Tax=Crenothrix polyspora TaxID=360316 RepID=A0A1R4H6N3_9GAMM|nr:DUF6519 domain-containing protein [Crenothrix polyspora]SJM91925.1 conserved hypothetical protein [Crenothrix polyspora]